MDSITAYGEKAKSGGPAGEILVRNCLTSALTTPNFFLPSTTVSLTVATSDASMLAAGASRDYDVYIFDPWTWAQKGWLLRDFARGKEDRVFVLDFFGSETSYTAAGRGRDSGVRGIAAPFEVSKQVLTAYPAPKVDKAGAYHGTFLGFYVDSSDVYGAGPGQPVPKEEGSVLIWGKSLEYYQKNLPLLRSLAATPGIKLASTLPAELGGRLAGLENVTYLGHLSPSEWRETMDRTAFVLGLKDPLLGPTGVEAVVHGAILVNPSYTPQDVGNNRGRGHRSQHGYLEDYVGEPRVCTVSYDDGESVRRCLEGEPMKEGAVPAEFTREAHGERVREIFGEAVRRGVERERERGGR